MASDNVKNLKAADFGADQLKGKGTILVDFWASWCGPCRMVAPIIDEIADEYAGKAAVGKLNVDEETAIAQKYGVSSIPTMIIFKDGEEQERIVGARNKAFIGAALERYI